MDAGGGVISVPTGCPHPPWAGWHNPRKETQLCQFPRQTFPGRSAAPWYPQLSVHPQVPPSSPPVTLPRKNKHLCRLASGWLILAARLAFESFPCINFRQNINMSLGSLFQEEKTGNPAGSLERKHVCWPRGACVTLEPLWEHLVLPSARPPALSGNYPVNWRFLLAEHSHAFLSDLVNPERTHIADNSLPRKCELRIPRRR